MSHSNRIGWRLLAGVVTAFVTGGVWLHAQGGRGGGPPSGPAIQSAMTNPYRIVENWSHLGTIKTGAAIGILPDGKGGAWLLHRSEPPILHIDASGNVVKSFGDGMFAQAHGFCQDRDGNFWAGDSGLFGDDPKRPARAS